MSEAPKLIAELLDASPHISDEAAEEVRSYLEYSEWGIAYDVFILLMRRTEWRPNELQITLLKQIASSMSVEYPNLSTGPDDESTP